MNNQQQKTFRLYWRDGTTNIVHGATIAAAMNASGYGAGSISALDFYNEKEEVTHEWVDGYWVRKDEQAVA